jgi:hypothetical protein
MLLERFELRPVSLTERMDYAEFPHWLHQFRSVDGRVLCVGHGTPDGYFVWTDSDGTKRYLDGAIPEDAVLVCCHPSEVAKRYPDACVAASTHEGRVAVRISLDDELIIEADV